MRVLRLSEPAGGKIISVADCAGNRRACPKSPEGKSLDAHETLLVRFAANITPLHQWAKC